MAIDRELGILEAKFDNDEDAIQQFKAKQLEVVEEAKRRLTRAIMYEDFLSQFDWKVIRSLEDKVISLAQIGCNVPFANFMFKESVNIDLEQGLSLSMYKYFHDAGCPIMTLHISHEAYEREAYRKYGVEFQ